MQFGDEINKMLRDLFPDSKQRNAIKGKISRGQDNITKMDNFNYDMGIDSRSPLNINTLKNIAKSDISNITKGKIIRKGISDIDEYKATGRTAEFNRDIENTISDLDLIGINVSPEDLEKIYNTNKYEKLNIHISNFLYYQDMVDSGTVYNLDRMTDVLNQIYNDILQLINEI